MPHGTMDHHELVRRGQAYCDSHLRQKLEPQHHGKFLALEVESGDYEIDQDEMSAIARVWVKHPHRLFYVLRIGWRAAHRIGGRSLRRSP